MPYNQYVLKPKRTVFVNSTLIDSYSESKLERKFRYKHEVLDFESAIVLYSKTTFCCFYFGYTSELYCY